MKDLTEGNLDKALEFAKSINDDSLSKCLDRLRKVEQTYKENGEEVETDITDDFAPHSFYFVRYVLKTKEFRGNGGIIFHGTHDNGGDGGAPTFSVNLTPCTGWSIHT